MGRILIIGVWLVGQASVTRIMIQSQINPATAARIGLVQLPFFVTALWFGIAHFGPIGAASVVVLRSLVDYGLLLWISRIHARPVAADMLMHLAFLIAGLGVAFVTDPIEYPLQSIAAAFVISALNCCCSLLMRPALRSMARSFVHELNVRLKRRVKSTV